MPDVLAPLRGFATPPEWLVAAADGERVAAALAGEVPELRLAGTTVRVEDLRLKDGAWTGRYVVDWVGADGTPRSAAIIGTTTGGRRGHGSAGRPSDQPFGAPGWRATLDELTLHLATAEPDRKLRGLPTILDPATAATWLASALATRFPGIQVDGCAPVVARYRPGQRCTVLCHLAYGGRDDRAWPQTVVVKLHRRGEGTAAWHALQALAAIPTCADGLDFAEPLAYVAEDDASVQGVLPADRDLADLVVRAASGDPGAADRAGDDVQAVGRALAALHALPVELGAVRTIDDEIRSARRAAERLTTACPELAGVADPLIGLIARRAGASSPGVLRPSHGAFRPAQVRLHGDRVGVLDLDKFGRSDPAEDLGRFVGKLRLLALVSASGHGPGLTLGDDLAATFQTAHGERAAVAPEPVALWEALDLLNTLFQTWSRVRPAQIDRVLALLDRTVARLGP